MPERPNILIILADDLGYSDLGCYGGEIDTPHLDRLAAGGLRFRHFYNTPRCSPSRASLLTGLHPHQAGIGVLTDHNFPGDYDGKLNDRCVTIPEVLKEAGYRSVMSGKWHLTGSFDQPDGAWPVERGFDHHFGIMNCGGSFFNPKTLVRGTETIEAEAEEDPHFYMTEAISDDAVHCIEQHFREHPDQPLFQYVAYTAPHSPIHARPKDVEKYRGRFAKGWDALRRERFERQRELGVIADTARLSPKDPVVPAWDSLPEELQEWEQRRMEVYAAMIDTMDAGIGRILDALESCGQLDNTLIFFLSDNGASAEGRGAVRGPNGEPRGDHPDLSPGGDDTWMHVGIGWANVSTTPYRLYKHWTHEGGISTPFLVHWPQGIADAGAIRNDEAYLPDLMATLLDLTDLTYPEQSPRGAQTEPLQGISLLPAFEGHGLPERLMFWEHEGNAAVREGRWKLVLNFDAAPSGQWKFREMRGDWELYDVEEDPSELRNIASQHPKRVQRMLEAWNAWADRSGVIPREKWLAESAAAKQP